MQYVFAKSTPMKLLTFFVASLMLSSCKKVVTIEDGTEITDETTETPTDLPTGEPVATSFHITVPTTQMTVDQPMADTIVAEVLDQYGDSVIPATGSQAELIAIYPSNSSTGVPVTAAVATAEIVGSTATFSGFSFPVTTAGNLRFRARIVGSSVSALSSPVQVTAGAMASLAFEVQPATGRKATDKHSVRIKALDQFSNLATSANSTIQLLIRPASGPDGGSLTGTVEKNLVNGVVTFSDLGLPKSGSNYVLRAQLKPSGSDPVAILSDSNSFNVIPGSVSFVRFTSAPPAGVAPYEPFSFALEAVDAEYNRVTNFAGAITVSCTGLIGTKTRSMSAGLVEFPELKLSQMGNQSLQISAPGMSTIAQNIAVVGAVKELTFYTQPTTGVFDIPSGNIRLLVADSNGTPIPNFAPAVSLTVLSSNPTGGLITSDVNGPVVASGGVATIFGTADGAGVVTFSGLTFNKAARYKLRASFTKPSDGSLVTTDSNEFSITGAAAGLRFVAQPATPISAGANVNNFAVQAIDSLGNVVTNYTTPIKLQLLPSPTATSVVSPTVQNFKDNSAEKIATPASGAALFSFGYKKAGNFLLRATSGSLPVLHSNAMIVNPGDPINGIFTVQPPASAVAGVALASFAVQLRDLYDNPITAVKGVTMTLSDANGVLAGTSVVNTSAGTATFSALKVNTALAGLRLRGLFDGTKYTEYSSTFNIVPAAHSAFKVMRKVGSTSSASLGLVRVGEDIADSIHVQAVDAFGNLVTSYNSPVTLKMSANPQTDLVGTLTRTAVNGEVEFDDIKYNSPRLGAIFTAFKTGGSTPTGNSVSFDVIGNYPSQLTFDATAAPVATIATDTALPSFKIQVRDSAGSLMTNFNGDVWIEDNPVDLNDGGLVDSGNLDTSLKATATNGVATFTGFKMTRVGTAKQFRARLKGLGAPVGGIGTDVVMAAYRAVSVTVGAFAKVTVLANPFTPGLKAGQPFDVTVRATDAWDNPVASGAGTGAVTLSAEIPTEADPSIYESVKIAHISDPSKPVESAAGAPAGNVWGYNSVTLNMNANGTLLFPGIVLSRIGAGLRFKVAHAGKTTGYSPSGEITRDPADPAAFFAARPTKTYTRCFSVQPLPAGSPAQIRWDRIETDAMMQVPANAAKMGFSLLKITRIYSTDTTCGANFDDTRSKDYLRISQEREVYFRKNHSPTGRVVTNTYIKKFTITPVGSENFPGRTVNYAGVLNDMNNTPSTPSLFCGLSGWAQNTSRTFELSNLNTDPTASCTIKWIESMAATPARVTGQAGISYWGAFFKEYLPAPFERWNMYLDKQLVVPSTAAATLTSDSTVDTYLDANLDGTSYFKAEQTGN